MTAGSAALSRSESGAGPGLDLVALGRVSLDLFSTEVGAPFERIPGFDKRVGGSPSNVAVGASRLGLAAALLTAVGDDLVGDAVLRHLRDEKVAVTAIARKRPARTPLALLGIEPPDRFPLVFYRENPSDIHVDLSDLERSPIAETRSLLLSGTALARDPVQAVTLRAAEVARAAGAVVLLDLDLRPDQWHDLRAYGIQIRSLLPRIDVAIGTEEEWHAALDGDPARELDDRGRGALAERVGRRFERGVALIKRGARGVTLLQGRDVHEQPAFPVEVVNTVGAGDAFAAGLVYGRLRLADWPATVRFASACGALQAARPGCSDTMPYLAEVTAFLQLPGRSP